MKSLKALLVLLLCLTTAAGFSQIQRSRIFSQFPDIIDCSVSNLSNAFNSVEGETITLNFSNNFTITGRVTSNIQKYENLHSMTIIIPSYANAVFHLSKQTGIDNSISYIGRILSTEAQDGYEIKKDPAGNYQFKKIEEDKIRQLCSH